MTKPPSLPAAILTLGLTRSLITPHDYLNQQCYEADSCTIELGDLKARFGEPQVGLGVASWVDRALGFFHTGS